MDIVDYHNVIVVDCLSRLFRKSRRSKSAVTAWTIIEDTHPDLDIDVEPEDVEASLYSLFGTLDVVETPHAAPRFLVEKAALDNVIRLIGDTHPDTRRAMKLTSDLGWDWLGESITGAYEKAKSVSEPDGLWEPLAIDRPDATALEIADTFETLAEQVRGDNGYASTAPAERNEVVRRLGEAAEWLRHVEHLTASSVQVYLIWPLETLAARFSAKTAIGKAAQFAAGVVAAWLKSHGLKVLDKLFGS